MCVGVQTPLVYDFVECTSLAQKGGPAQSRAAFLAASHLRMDSHDG